MNFELHWVLDGGGGGQGPEGYLQLLPLAGPPSVLTAPVCPNQRPSTLWALPRGNLSLSHSGASLSSG